MYGSHYGFDDMHYARLAHELSNGLSLDAGDHYTFRWMYLGPVAMCYKIFGVNDFSSGLWSMICVLFTAFFLFKSVDRKLPMWHMVALGLLLCSTTWIGQYGDKLMPDVPAMMAVMMSFYGLYRYFFEEGSNRLNAFIFIGGLVIGFLIKESIVIALPAIFVLFCIDIWRKRKLDNFWFQSTLMGITSALIYLGICYIFFGHAFARAISIAANGYLSDCSYDQLPFSATWSRISHELWNRMLDGSMLLGLPFLVLAFFSDGKAKFWAITSIGLLLCANFMTTSLKHYVPLCPDVRHYLWFTPAMIAMIGNIDVQKVEKKWFWISVISAILLLFWAKESVAILNYVVVLLLLILALHNKMFISVCFLLIAANLTYKSYLDSLPFNYESQKILLKKHLVKQQHKEKPLIISNSVEINIDKYVLGFDTTYYNFVKEQDVDSTTVANHGNAIFISNGMTLHLSGKGWGDHPSWVRNGIDKFILIDSMENIEWYKVKF